MTVSAAQVMETGDPLAVTSIKVEADRDLVWAETGTPLKAILSTVTSPFQLPVTDQEGWLLNGLPVDVSNGKQSHSYTLRVVYAGGEKKFYTIGPFVLPEDDGSTVDADTMTPVCQPDGGGTIVIPDVSAELAALDDKIDGEIQDRIDGEALLQAQIDAITASDVESVNGVVGAVLVSLLDDGDGFYDLVVSN